MSQSPLRPLQRGDRKKCFLDGYFSDPPPRPVGHLTELIYGGRSSVVAACLAVAVASF